MKKAIKLLTVLCVVAMVLSTVLCANAAVPTALTIDEVKTSPVIDGKLDDVYGAAKWDQNATDLKVPEFNLFPRTEEEFTPEMKSVYNVMNMKGWLVYDSKALYIAVKAKDTFPKAADNNQKPWNSTNIQIVLYVDSSRYFFTVAYEGEGGKFGMFNDATRSELDMAKMSIGKDVVCTNNVGDLFYEVRIPFEALYDINKITKDTDIRLGIVQTSYAQGYLCQAFGEAYGLQYDKLIPVTPVPAATTTTTPSQQQPTSSVDSTAAPDADAGVDLGGETSSTVSDASSDVESKDDASATTSEVEEGGNTTLIIILAAVGALIIIGAVVAIIIISKKK